MKKIAVIQFPGSNCQRETKLAIERAQMNPIDFLWNEDLNKLSQCDGYVIVGGFSYEDRGRAGLIAALDPVLKTLTKQTQQGKPLLGICNGAQILVESGLIPGLDNHKKVIALTDNQRLQNGEILGTGFYNSWVNIKPSNTNNDSAFSNAFSNEQTIHIPAAHAEGRFLLDDSLYQALLATNATCFYYCDKQGHTHSEFPTNPNGSQHNLAAISNASGNIMAMMPHPERTPAGDIIFHSMRYYLERNGYQGKALNFSPTKQSTSVYQVNANHLELLVELNIQDNTTISLNKALQQAGINTKLRRLTHWEVSSNQLDQANLTGKLQASYELFNPQKEQLVDKQTLTAPNKRLLLVREKDNLLGHYKQQTLAKHFDLKEIDTIKHGILWQIESSENLDQVTKQLKQLAIFANPVAHECYDYAPN